MSHHRETVTAAGAPAAAGPYSHAVKAGGLVFLLRPDPARPRQRRARRAATPASRRGAAWTTSPIVAAAAGA